MSRREAELPLRHMLDAVREIADLARNVTRQAFLADRLRTLAVVRLLEVLGEAASRVQPEERRRFPRIPWAQVVAMRNRLIHGYDMVDLEIVWSIVSDDLPKLRPGLEKALGSIRKD